MADILANKPALITSAITASFSSLGIDETIVSKIYEEPSYPGGNFKSFNPLSSLNSLNGFTYGKNYLVYPKVDFQVDTLYFISNPSFIVSEDEYNSLSDIEKQSDNLYVIPTI